MTPLHHSTNIFLEERSQSAAIPTCYPVLALVVGGRDGLDDAESSLATRSLVLLVVEQVRIVIFLLAKEVVLLVGIKVSDVRRNNYTFAH